MACRANSNRGWRACGVKQIHRDQVRLPNDPVMALQQDVIIVGAGAAGMMCAIEAGKRGRSVLLLDHASRLAEKIRISGGGRCNFTNRYATPENYLSRNLHFCRSALARFPPQKFIELVEKHRISYHEKKLGQLFCDESSRQIIELLRQECDAAGVAWKMPCRIHGVGHDGTGFRLNTDHGVFTSHALVIATGGLSIPKIGASPFGYKVAKQFDIAVTPLCPALVPLILAPEQLDRFKGLAGISIDVEVTCNKKRFRENLLFTHRGLSGPVILQASSYWKAGLPIHVNFLPDPGASAWLLDQRRSPAFPSNVLAQCLPRRFIGIWIKEILASQPESPMNQCSDKFLAELTGQLHDWRITPYATAGYDKAEVTLGGIDTRELSSRTMETRKVPGLYFIGEVVDVTGQLGGYNFQWAWASGYAAGQFA